MSLMSVLYATLLCSLGTLGNAQTLLAQLDYGNFQGAYSSTYNVSYWQKIPFAAPPIGQNRFRGPQPPNRITNGTYDSTQTFDMCPQRTVNGSEDCLFLGLYSRPWTKGQPLRPVIVNFFGGGYIEGDAFFTVGGFPGYPTLNVSTLNNFVYVSPNYRTNAFGFLPGKEIAEDRLSDLNPGLLDQHMALKWTNQNIAQFGGDPDSVAIWGASAGAGSVVAQVIAQTERSSAYLFNKALASSPFWSKTYNYDSPEAQSVYDTFASLAGCFGPNSLQCLKNADLQTLRNAAGVVAGSHTYNTSSYTWGPVIDTNFLTKPLSVASSSGLKVEYGWGMYNLHEGENFIPGGLKSSTNAGSPPFNSSLASFQKWLAGYLPGLSASQLLTVQHLYPVSGSAEGLPSYNTTYVRAGLIFRDSVLACPGYWMAGASQNTSYVGEYTIAPATHGSDTMWWSKLNAIQKTDPLTYQGYTGAFASFFQTGDPNAHKVTNSSIAGVGELYNSLDSSSLFKGEEEFLVGQDMFSNVSISQFQLRCSFWKSVASSIPI